MFLVLTVIALIHGTIRPCVDSIAMHLVHKVVAFIPSAICVRQDTLPCALAMLPFTLIAFSIGPSHHTPAGESSVLVFTNILAPCRPCLCPMSMLAIVLILALVPGSVSPGVDTVAMHGIVHVFAFIPSAVLVSKGATTMIPVVQPFPIINSAVIPQNPPFASLLVVNPIPLEARAIVLDKHMVSVERGERHAAGPINLPALLLTALPLPCVFMKLLESLIVCHSSPWLHLICFGTIGENKEPIGRLAIRPLTVEFDLICPGVDSMPVLHVVSVFALIFPPICESVYPKTIHFVLMVHAHISASAFEGRCSSACALAIKPLPFVSPSVSPSHDSQPSLCSIHILPLVSSASRPGL
mmetsp:Transcript_8626/g.13624  ORF Transcript_8626/g.13624 Transcript_8626/m.13624 type:complete len:355 (+) Transcript_8626:969-2033(+)